MSSLRSGDPYAVPYRSTAAYGCRLYDRFATSQDDEIICDRRAVKWDHCGFREAFSRLGHHALLCHILTKSPPTALYISITNNLAVRLGCTGRGAAQKFVLEYRRVPAHHMES